MTVETKNMRAGIYLWGLGDKKEGATSMVEGNVKPGGRGGAQR